MKRLEFTRVCCLQMALLAKAAPSFDPIPAGSAIATCVQVVDLGTQTYQYQGKDITSRKIRVTWELPYQKRTDDKPHLVSNSYTLSLSDKAALRKDLESWLGRALTADEKKDGYDVRQLLGKSCMLGVIHKEKDGKTYSNINAIMPLPVGMDAPTQVTPSLFFSLVSSQQVAAEIGGLPEFVSELIKKSPEYQRLVGGDVDITPEEFDELDNAMAQPTPVPGVPSTEAPGAPTAGRKRARITPPTAKAFTAVTKKLAAPGELDDPAEPEQ